MDMPKDYTHVFLRMTDLLLWDVKTAMDQNIPYAQMILFIHLLEDYKKRLHFILQKPLPSEELRSQVISRLSQLESSLSWVLNRPKPNSKPDEMLPTEQDGWVC